MHTNMASQKCSENSFIETLGVPFPSRSARQRDTGGGGGGGVNFRRAFDVCACVRVPVGASKYSLTSAGRDVMLAPSSSAVRPVLVCRVLDATSYAKCPSAPLPAPSCFLRRVWCSGIGNAFQLAILRWDSRPHMQGQLYVGAQRDSSMILRLRTHYGVGVVESRRGRRQGA